MTCTQQPGIWVSGLTRDVGPADISDALSGATVHIGVCTVRCIDGALVVFGENEHVVGKLTDLTKSSAHLAREIEEFVQEEHRQL